MSVQFPVSDPSPYPPVRVERQNPGYAAMLSANFAAGQSELTAITTYLYQSLVLRPHHPETAALMRSISIVEMRHLDIFGQLILLLGGDPQYRAARQNCAAAWNGNMVPYRCALGDSMRVNIAAEREAIHTYSYQATVIEDRYICALLNRIILDEELHLRIFRRLLAESC